jgi:hypothetical protein
MMWLLTAFLAYVLCAIGYGFLRAGSVTIVRLAWIMPIIFAGSICFAITYRLGPKFLTIWFVTAGIGTLVGFLGSRALQEKIGLLEIICVGLIVSGTAFLIRGQ